MASGSRARCSPFNLATNPTINSAGSAQDPAEGPAKGPGEGPAESASTAGSEAATIPSHTDTPAASRVPIPASAPTPTSTKNLLQQLITTYAATLKALEQSQTAQTQAGANQEPREKLLKDRNLDLYLGKLHIDCYNFC